MADTDTMDDELTRLSTEQPVDVEVDAIAHDTERFDRIGLLGKGGMGEVRLYRDRRISRYVAYKVLRAPLHKDPRFRARFLLEARVQGQLEHPSIVPVHDLGETENGEPFFSMKCVRGVTLRQALSALDETYSRRRLLTAFSSVCLAVDFAHSRGVVHRDLKPQNIMLGRFGEVYVLDWGIAKVMDRPETPLDERVEIDDVAQTRTGATLGTPRYMAPERGFGVANPCTDVYALGVILADILTADATLDIPPELAAIQLRATCLSAGERYQTARALHLAIEKYLDGDRDLEARRKLAEEHAARAEDACERAHRDPGARTVAGNEIGRALGLDPSNARALRVLMRLLSEPPAQLPAAAQATLVELRRARSRRTLFVTSLTTSLNVLTLPMYLWMGIRNWGVFAVWTLLMISAAATQYIGARTKARWAFPVSYTVLVATFAMQTTSMGMFGAVPAAMGVVAMAGRLQVTRAVHGVVIMCLCIAGMIVPLLTFANYTVRDGTITILPLMHEFPRTPTLAFIILGVAGAMAVAVLYGRLATNELLRAEERLHFQAWQLQQLLPPG